MFSVHWCISSIILVNVPPVYSHQSPASDIHLSSSRGIQPKSISVTTPVGMGPRTSLHRHLVNRCVEWTRFHALRTGWCSSLFSSQKRIHQRENAETCLNGRVMLPSHSYLDGGDGPSLMSTNTRTCSCCASKLGRQAILLHPLGNGRPKTCGVELDRSAVFPCQHFHFFPRRFAARSLWLRSCAVSWLRQPHQCPSPALRPPLECGGRSL